MKNIYRIALLVALSTLCAFGQGASLGAAARARSRAGKSRRARPRRRREAQAAATEISHAEVAYGRTGVTWSRFNEAIDDLTALSRQKQWRKPRGPRRSDDLRRRAHGDAIAILQWIYYRMTKVGFENLSRGELTQMVVGLKLVIATAARTKLRKPNPRLAKERLALVRAALARARREPTKEPSPIQVPSTEPSLEPTPVSPGIPEREDLAAKFARIREGQVWWLDEHPVRDDSDLPFHRKQIGAFYEEINPYRELDEYNEHDVRLQDHRAAVQREEARRTQAGGFGVTAEPLPPIIIPPLPRPPRKPISQAPILQEQTARRLATLIEHHVESIARAGDNLLEEAEVRGFIEAVQNFDQTNLNQNAIAALEGHRAYLGTYLDSVLERAAFEQEALVAIDELIAGLRLNEALAAIADHASYEAELRAASARLTEYAVDGRSSLAVRMAVRRGVQYIVDRLVALRLEVARREREQRDAEQRARTYQLEKAELEKLHRHQMAAFEAARLELQGHMNAFEAQTQDLDALNQYEATFRRLLQNLHDAEIGEYVAPATLSIEITNMQRRIANTRQDFLDAARLQAEREAAINIQRIGRGYLGRKRALRLQATRALDAIMEAHQGRLREAQKEGFSSQVGVDIFELLLAELNRLDTTSLDEQGQVRLANFRNLAQEAVEGFRQKVRLEREVIEEQKRRAKEEAAATKIQALYRGFQVRKALRSEAEKRQFIHLVIDAARADPQAYPVEIYQSILKQGDARLAQYLKEDPSEELRALIMRAHAAIQAALRDMQERVELARVREEAAKIIPAIPPSAMPELPVVDIDAILQEEEERIAREKEAAQERLRKQKLAYERAQERKRRREEEQEEEHKRAQEAQRRREQREEEDRRRLEQFKAAQRLRAEQEEQRHRRALQHVQAEQARLRQLQQDEQRRKREEVAQSLAAMIADHNQKIAKAQALPKGRNEAIRALMQGSIFEEGLGLLPQARSFDLAQLSQDAIRMLDAHITRLEELLERAKGRIRQKIKRRREKAAATKIQALYRGFQVRKALRSEAEKRQFIHLVIDAARADPQAYPVEIYQSILKQGDARLAQYLKEDPSEELRALIMRAHAAIQAALQDMQERVELARVREEAAKIIPAIPPSVVPELPVVDIDAILQEEEERERITREKEAARIALIPDNLKSLAKARDRDVFKKLESFEDELANKDIEDWSDQEHLMDMLLKRIKSHNTNIQESRDEGELTVHKVRSMLDQLDYFRSEAETLDELASSVLAAHISYLEKLSGDLRGRLEEAPVTILPELPHRNPELDRLDEEGFTQLHRAAETGNLEKVLSLLAARATVDVRSRSEFTPLHIAAAYGHDAIAKALIAAGADVNAQEGFSDYPFTPLHWAAREGHLNVVRALIDGNVDVDAKEYSSYNPYTPLQLAVIGGNQAIVKELLDAGAAVGARALDGITPLQEAIRSGQLKIAEFLLSRGADIEMRDERGNTLLHLAAEAGEVDALNFLRRAGLNEVNVTNMYGITPLHLAAREGYAQIVTTLIEAEADPNARDKSGAIPLHVAAEKGHTQVVTTLIGAGADPNTRDMSNATPLKRAAYKGHENIVKMLHELQPKQSGLQRIFKRAVEDGSLPAVRSLIAAGASVSAEDFYGNRPLHWAAEKGYPDVARALIRAGADLNAVGEQGSTPLIVAAQEGSANVAQVLIADGADIHQTDEFGDSPLFWAVEKEHPDVVVALVAAGADVNEEIPWHGTLLHLAVERGHPDVVAVLAAAGADVNQKIPGHGTLLHLAAKQGDAYLIRVLVKAGAYVSAEDAEKLLPFRHAQGRAKTFLRQLWLEAGMKKDEEEKRLRLAREQAAQEELQEAQEELDETAQLQDAAPVVSDTVAEETVATPEVVGSLHDAARRGDLAAVQDHLAAGADVNMPDNEGNRPLHNAAARGSLEVIQALIDAGARVVDTNRRGLPPIAVAIERRRRAVAKLLHGLSPEYFIKVTNAGNRQNLERLIEAGLNVNVRDREQGLSPLHHAAFKNYPEIVQLLLRAGADVNARDDYDRTPLSLAEEQGHDNIVAILRKAGAGQEREQGFFGGITGLLRSGAAN